MSHKGNQLRLPDRIDQQTVDHVTVVEQMALVRGTITYGDFAALFNSACLTAGSNH